MRTPGGALLAMAVMILGGAVCSPAAANAPQLFGGRVDPLLGLRVRQEILPGVYYFDPVESDRDWIRIRTRAGLRWRPGDGHTLEFRLVNEFRKIIVPSGVDLDLDEVVIDRLAWTWRRQGAFPFTLTLGRQDVIWDDGFLILEGHPFDGSRTGYQNALRLVVDREANRTELLLMANPKRDPIVIAGDEDRALGEADERAVAVRHEWKGRGDEALRYQLAGIWKRDDDPDHLLSDLTTWTVSERVERRGAAPVGFLAEAALQYQDGRGTEGWAFALQANLRRTLGRGCQGELGYLHYSGRGGDVEGFIPPYGRWPKWSDLYLYTLIGEGGVALWQNMAGPHVHLSRVFDQKATVRLSAYVLYAPQDGWARRGELVQALAVYRVNEELSAHLLWEWLHAGDYPPGQEPDAHFIRWQLEYDIR